MRKIRQPFKPRSKSLYNNIVGLQSQLTTLHTANATLQKAATATTITNTTQSTSLVQLKAQMVTVLTSQIWALNPFVTLDLNVENEVNGPNLVFSGVNLILRTVLTAPDWVI
jgi:hypothetical protein